MIEWVLIIATCMLSALLAVRFLYPNTKATSSIFDQLMGSDRPMSRVYLFDGHDLIGSSHALDFKQGFDDWATLRRTLATRFPSFPESPRQVETQGTITIRPIDARSTQNVFFEWVDGVTRVELKQAIDHPENVGSNLQATSTQLSAMQNAPYPVWFVDSREKTTWCNTAYIELTQKVRDDDLNLSKPLFPDIGVTENLNKRNRVSITSEDLGAQLWFDLTVVSHETGFLCYAMDVNAVVDAEAAKRNFVQALTKIFSHLSIGLAMFDRNKQLALFNPALVDLTALPPDFLIDRPNVSNFFDRLRDHNLMPEPKNYEGWRHSIDDLFKAETSAQYEDTWTLPSGSVYSVNGRPHADGAVAFLFEDITAEVSLTRQFRAELEMGQAVIDRMPEAIAVFASDGTLALSNDAYNSLWNVDPDRSFAQITALDATRTWQDQCAASPIWGEVRDFVNSRENRTDWWAQVQLRSGAALTCSVKPLPNGATLVSFVNSEPEPQLVT